MKKSLKDIYFYNAHALAVELRNGTITEYRAVKHMIAAIVLGGIGFDIPVDVNPDASASGMFHFISFVIFFIVSAIISFYGVWLTHQVNSKGDGKDYFLRFTVLSLPVGIQLLVLFLWVGLALVALSSVLLFTFESAGVIIISILFYLAAIAFLIMFFMRIRKFISIASGVSE